MFEYVRIKTELEDFKCPVHGRSAMVSFKDGKLVLEKVCCEEHRSFLLESIPDVTQDDFAEIMLVSLAGI